MWLFRVFSWKTKSWTKFVDKPTLMVYHCNFQVNSIKNLASTTCGSQMFLACFSNNAFGKASVTGGYILFICFFLWKQLWDSFIKTCFHFLIRKLLSLSLQNWNVGLLTQLYPHSRAQNIMLVPYPYTHPQVPLSFSIRKKPLFTLNLIFLGTMEKKNDLLSRDLGWVPP